MNKRQRKKAARSVTASDIYNKFQKLAQAAIHHIKTTYPKCEKCGPAHCEHRHLNRCVGQDVVLQLYWKVHSDFKEFKSRINTKGLT